MSPGMGIRYRGAALLVAERFDRPDGELERLVTKMAAAAGPARG